MVPYKDPEQEKAYQRAYRYNHIRVLSKQELGEAALRAGKYYHTHADAINTKRQAKHASDIEAERAKARAYYARAKHITKASHDAARAKYRSSPKGKAAMVADRAKRRAKLKQAEGKFTAQEWLALKEYFGWRCPACGAPETLRKLTADHIIPLGLGGTNWISNIQPLCHPCNDKKFTKAVCYRPWQENQ